MKYVTSTPGWGRVGHQLAGILLARYIAEAFGFTYLHEPLRSYPSPIARAAMWEPFFALGAGELQHSNFIRKKFALIHQLPDSDYNPWRWPKFQQFSAMLNGVAEDMIFVINDSFGSIDTRQLLIWERHGWVPTGSLERTAQWFYNKMAASPLYQQTPVLAKEGQRTVACYRRGNGKLDNAPSRYDLPREYFEQAILQAHEMFPGQELWIPLFSQGPATLFEDWPAEFEVNIVEDAYPRMFTVMKTFMECDLFVGSTGHSTRIVQFARYGQRRPWFQHAAEFTVGGVTL